MAIGKGGVETSKPLETWKEITTQKKSLLLCWTKETV